MKQKTWFVDSVAISQPDDLYDMADARFVPTYAARVRTFLKRQTPLAIYISREIWALRLRRPYREIRFIPAQGCAGSPAIKRDLISTFLSVQVDADFSQMLRCSETDEALSDLFVALFRSGFIQLNEKTLQDACARAIKNYQTANYQALLWTPYKHRIEGTNIMAEIAYYATPTAKTCSVKLWRAKRPHPCFQTSFALVEPPEKDGVVSMAEYAPAQVAILKDDRIEFGTQTRNGTTPHPDLAQYAVALTSLEAKIGPIKRQEQPGHLRLV